MNCKEESIRQVLDDYNLSLPDEAIGDIIRALDMCDEYASYSTGGYDPQAEEIRKLKTALKREQEKVICSYCKGAGRTVSHGPHHSANMTCPECNGSGYIYY